MKGELLNGCRYLPEGNNNAGGEASDSLLHTIAETRNSVEQHTKGIIMKTAII